MQFSKNAALSCQKRYSTGSYAHRNIISRVLFSSFGYCSDILFCISLYNLTWDLFFEYIRWNFILCLSNFWILPSWFSLPIGFWNLALFFFVFAFDFAYLLSFFDFPLFVNLFTFFGKLGFIIFTCFFCVYLVFHVFIVHKISLF